MKPYPSYKDSGVEWIGKIPIGWALSNVKYLLKDDGFRSGPFGSSLITNQLAESGNYLVYTPEHLTDKKIEYPLFVPLEREDELKKYEIRDGDIVLPIVGTLGRGKLFTSQDKKGILNQRLCRISPDPNKVVFQYILNFLTNTNLVKIQFDLEKKGSILDHITREIIFNLQLPFPPLPEQKQIISFLDHKTQKIDKLIEKTEKKIELLKEKRTSLINHCVTKGLNPNVEMKDSEVEWIGEIPSGWDIIKIKWITSNHRQGYYSSQPYDDEGYKVVRITDLNDDHTITFNDSPYYIVSNEEYERFHLNDGDFLFPRTGSIGKFGIYNSDYLSIYGSFLIRFRFSEIVQHTLIKYFLDSSIYLNQLKEQIHGGVNKNVHVENIKNCFIPYPNDDFEQQQIVEYLDEQTQWIDSTIEKETQWIELLQEYRQSLISEVVTGKIDVRDEVVI